jgi:hypothetical protein
LGVTKERQEATGYNALFAQQIHSAVNCLIHLLSQKPRKSIITTIAIIVSADFSPFAGIDVLALSWTYPARIRIPTGDLRIQPPTLTDPVT